MNYTRLGFKAIANGDYQEALNLFNRAMEKGKSAINYHGLGVASFYLEDFPVARWAFHQALNIDPKHESAQTYLQKLESRSVTQTSCAQPHQSIFRVGDNYLEIFRGSWRKFFFKGINMGLGLPGHFPGEYPIKKRTYLQWFKLIAELGANSIRTYAIHPPAFYEALAALNQLGKELYLFQGIWTEPPANGNFRDQSYVAYVQQSIREAIDIVHGNARLPERPGYPNGVYQADVSSCTAALIFGREWESCSLTHFNNQEGNVLRDYTGTFLTIKGGTPFEIWIAETSNYLQEYEFTKYKCSHPLAVNNWPTLDPFAHPSESNKKEELSAQGLPVGGDFCSSGGYLALQEDMESLDISKIRAVKGAGFFASYHVYPYYPDFMVNDYLGMENTYGAYLAALKKHHGKQPVLIAEFGVPSSREIAHWHRDGWNHGGHSETSQGEVNGQLMASIHKSGMAGGLLFSWFDEWFKRNWLLAPYEIPADRKPFWYCSQDAEEHYGLLGLYPGYPAKKVHLDNRAEEWRDAKVLYESKENADVFRFNDGFDGARTLTRLLAQHDEGFLYLRLETAAEIDFEAAHYMIGIDTGYPETGEFLLPFGTGVTSPVGLKFLVHLAGKGKSRLLCARSYDKYFNNGGQGTPEIHPVPSREGEWVAMQSMANRRRMSKDGSRVFPARVFPVSPLRHGSLSRKNPAYNSLSDIYVSGNSIELRIPWSMINVTDPSSRSILWMDRSGSQTKSTDGIRLFAVSYKPEKGGLIARKIRKESNIVNSLPTLLTTEQLKTYSWEGWTTPVYHSYLKDSYGHYRKALTAIPEEL